MANRCAKRGEGGFTLLEMMVALAVFSLAALALVKLQAFSLRTAGDVERASLARTVAQNRAVEILTDPAPPPLGESGGTTVNGGRSHAWAQQVAFTADRRLMRVDIVVTPQGGAPVSLTVIRPAA